MGTLFTEIADPENAAPGSGTAESSPSLVSYSQDFGPKVIEKSFRIGGIVEIHMRTTRNGSVSQCGEVTVIDVKRPETDTCPSYFRRVLKLIHHPSRRL